jgi:hypothetical protein
MRRVIRGAMRVLGIVFLLWGAERAVAQPSPADKGHYTLFNPTPRHLMREMSTDRPDTTESPFSVDAGHVQVELSFVDYAHNDDGGERTDSLSVLPTNVKLGLLNNVDVQFVFTPYVREETEGAGTSGATTGRRLDSGRPRWRSCRS